MKPLIKYTGSKYNQVDILAEVERVWMPYKSSHTLIEPFCGGLGLTMAIHPLRAILSDCNEWVIDFYNAVKSGCEWEVKYRQLLIDEGYNNLRSIFNLHIETEHLSQSEFMTVFYLINKASFKGLWQINSTGGFNCPMGRINNEPIIPSLPKLSPYRSVFENWFFNVSCYSDFLAEVKTKEKIYYHKKDLFIYADPPYDKVKQEENYTGYSQQGFNWSDQLKLAYLLSDLDFPIVVSNAATDRIIDLYSSLGFDFMIIEAKRSLSIKAGKRKGQNEVLMIKNMK